MDLSTTISKLANFLHTTPFNLLFVTFLVTLCSFVLIMGVIISFIEYHNKGALRQKRSAVATFTMILFFLLLYIIIIKKIGTLKVDTNVHMVFIVIGSLLMVTGTVLNIKGRFDLNKNWANHIKIYKDHKLVTTGSYNLVRHPLYAGLLWFGIGVCIAYANLLGLIALICIFVPMMVYRANQEEDLLSQEFSEYAQYKQNVGLFFPKLKKTVSESVKNK